MYVFLSDVDLSLWVMAEPSENEDKNKDKDEEEKPMEKDSFFKIYLFEILGMNFPPFFIFCPSSHFSRI